MLVRHQYLHYTRVFPRMAVNAFAPSNNSWTPMTALYLTLLAGVGLAIAFQCIDDVGSVFRNKY